jgi:hypothetical protein
MRFFVRLVISLAGGLAALAMLLMFLTFVISEWSTPRGADVPASTIDGRAAARTDFELLGNGVIVPVRAAPELLNQCSRETVSPVQGYWRPTPRMIAELEERLRTFLAYESRVEPLRAYIGQYAGVTSAGRRLIYASYVVRPLNVPWQEQVVVVCDGGNRAWGIAYDVDGKTFEELRINGTKPALSTQ